MFFKRNFYVTFFLLSARVDTPSLGLRKHENHKECLQLLAEQMPFLKKNAWGQNKAILIQNILFSNCADFDLYKIYLSMQRTPLS